MRSIIAAFVMLCAFWTTFQTTAEAGQGYNVTVQNSTAMSLSTSFVSDGNGYGSFCWYQKNLLTSPSTLSTGSSYGPGYTQFDQDLWQAHCNGGTDPTQNKFTLLYTTGWGTLSALQVVNSGNCVACSGKKDYVCPGTEDCIEVENYSIRGADSLNFSVSTTATVDSSKNIDQTITVSFPSSLYSIPSGQGIALSAQNLTTSTTANTSATTSYPVYKIVVTGAQFVTSNGSPASTQNRTLLLTPYQVLGSTDNTNWTQIGMLLPPGGATLTNSATFQLGKAAFYYQGNSTTNYQYLQVKQCVVQQSSLCSTATTTLSQATTASSPPANLADYSITLSPAVSQSGSQAYVVANGIAQEQIGALISDQNGNPVATSGQTYSWLYQNIYFVDPTTHALITNLYAASGYTSITDQPSGPYTALYGQTASPAAATVSGSTAASGYSFYFSSTEVGQIGTNGSVQAALSISGSNACSQAANNCMSASINGVTPAPLTESSTTAPNSANTASISFSGNVYSPTTPSIPYFFINVGQSQPYLGMIDSYLALWYCVPNEGTDNNAYYVSAALASVQQASPTAITFQQANTPTNQSGTNTNCAGMPYAYTVVDLFGNRTSFPSSP